MNKIIVKSEQGRTSIILNGMEMHGVKTFSISQKAGEPFPMIRIEMFGNNSEIETDGEVETE